MQIIQKKPIDLRGYERNARTHDEAQINQIIASIREFGFNNPILVDETDTIIAGHGRLAAALRMGMEQVPCIVLAHLSEAQRRAYILADNKIALNAGWDAGLLRLEMDELMVEGNFCELTGFSDVEIDDLLISRQEEHEIDNKIELQKGLQLRPPSEYLVCVAKDAAEWDEMVEFFQLQRVRKGGYVIGSAFDAVGIERVITFSRVKDAYSHSK